MGSATYMSSVCKKIRGRMMAHRITQEQTVVCVRDVGGFYACHRKIKRVVGKPKVIYQSFLLQLLL